VTLIHALPDLRELRIRGRNVLTDGLLLRLGALDLFIQHFVLLLRLIELLCCCRLIGEQSFDAIVVSPSDVTLHPQGIELLADLRDTRAGGGTLRQELPLLQRQLRRIDDPDELTGGESLAFIRGKPEQLTTGFGRNDDLGRFEVAISVGLVTVPTASYGDSGQQE
jgi:hypothetical protein